LFIKQVDGGLNISESESEGIDCRKRKVDWFKKEAGDDDVDRCGDEGTDRSEGIDRCVEAIDCCDGGGVNTCRLCIRDMCRSGYQVIDLVNH